MNKSCVHRSLSDLISLLHFTYIRIIGCLCVCAHYLGAEEQTNTLKFAWSCIYYSTQHFIESNKVKYCFYFIPTDSRFYFFNLFDFQKLIYIYLILYFSNMLTCILIYKIYISNINGKICP